VATIFSSILHKVDVRLIGRYDGDLPRFVTCSFAIKIVKLLLSLTYSSNSKSGTQKTADVLLSDVFDASVYIFRVIVF